MSILKNDWGKFQHQPKSQPLEFVGAIHSTVVHSFMISDMDDPDIMAGEHLWKWQESEAGKWVLENAIETPEWRRQLDSLSYGYKYLIIAKLTDKALVYYKLRWT